MRKTYDYDHILVKSCPLCAIFLDPEHNIKSRVYHPTHPNEIKYNDFIIVFNKECSRPMVIVRDHVTEISSELWGRILYRCRKLFGANIKLNIESRKIQDHWSATVIRPRY